MAKKKSNPRVGKVEPLDLRKVNPSGRIDVLAASAIERFASNIPELLPIVNDKRGVIHAALNEKLGPHVMGFDLVGVVKDVGPYLPLLEMVARSVYLNYITAKKRGDSTDESKGKGDVAC